MSLDAAAQVALAPAVAGVLAGPEPGTGISGTTPSAEVAVAAIDTPATEAAEVSRPRRRWVRRALIGVLVAGLAAEIVLAAPYLARGADALADSKLSWLVVAVLAELVSMRAFARMRRRMLAAGGVTVRLRRMEALTYASTAVGSTFPGGAALSSGFLFKKLRDWGATTPAAGFAVLSSSVLSVVAYALLALAAVLVAGSGGITTFVTAGVVVAVTLLVVYVGRHADGLDHASRRVLHGVNRVLRRPHEAGVAGLNQFVTDLRAIHPRTRDWALGLGFGLLNWAADLACLILCCEAVGADRSSVALMTVAYVAGQSVSSVTFSPGGLGIIDAAMIFAMTRGGESAGLATGGVMLYRLISLAMVAAIGWALWLGAGWLERRRAG